MKRWGWTSCSLALAAVLVFTAASCKQKTAATKTLPPGTVEEIDAVVAEFMKEHGSPGAMVGVWTAEGTAFTKMYGLAGISPERAMSEKMEFRIGSVTKTFTGVLVLQLADEGLLSIDDPVSKFVEGIPDGDLITVRMLLNHTSGIFNYGADVKLNEAIVADPHKVWTPEELVGAGIANPPYFAPGQGCMYSNTNYVLLGMIVEKATGRSFEEELAKRITGPLGLASTYMAETPYLAGSYVHGYQYDRDSGENFDLTDYLDPSIVWAAGGMVSTLQDLRTWGQALGEGRLLEPATYRAALEGMNELPYMTDYFGWPLLYGLGIMACFIGLGLLITVVLGKNIATLAGNPWTNLVIAGLFVVFGLGLIACVRAARREAGARLVLVLLLATLAPAFVSPVDIVDIVHAAAISVPVALLAAAG